MSTSQIIALTLGIGTLGILLIVAFCIPFVIAEWKLFKKAGKNGWEALIPYYSTWVLIEIAGLNWWYFLIVIVGTILNFLDIEGLGIITNIAGMFINFLIFYNIAKKMKQSEIAFGILGAILPLVTILVFGYSKYTFDNSIPVSPNGIIGDNNTNQTNTVEKYCLGCGQKLSDDVKFCKNCGKKVNDTENK